MYEFQSFDDEDYLFAKYLRHVMDLLARVENSDDIALRRDTYRLALDAIEKIPDRDKIREYIYALGERTDEPDSYYRVTDDYTLRSLKRSLEARAYGNFGEAMLLLCDDFRTASEFSHCRSDPAKHKVFRPEYFVNAKERTTWHEYTEKLADIMEGKYASPEEVAETAVEEIRDRLQDYLGPLHAVLTATYIKDHQRGYTVTASLQHGYVSVSTTAPFAPAIDDAFTGKNLDSQPEKFTSALWPKQIGDYILEDTDSTRLFDFEIDPDFLLTK